MSRSATKTDKTFWLANRFRSALDVNFGEVDPKHVRVEAYHGEAENGGIKNPMVTVLTESGRNGDGSYIYQGSVPASESGAYGFSVRVVPTHPEPDASPRTAPDHLVVRLR